MSSASSLSCNQCKKRKVKCDRENPCSACVRANSECMFPAARAPYKRKRKEEREESAFKERRVQDETISTKTQPSTVKPSSMQPTEMATRFGQRLWTGLPEKFREPRKSKRLGVESEQAGVGSPDTESITNISSFIFAGMTPSSVIALQDTYPTPMNAFSLWQIYLERVNPLSKLIYVPTVQNLIVDGSRDFSSVSKGSAALLFAIHSAAVMSMKDEECKSKLGESRNTLLQRYLMATRQALAAAAFMQSTSLVVLQAFAIFIIATRSSLPPETLWILSGMAIRMGQRIDLLTPKGDFFETQMRKRVLWYIIWIDGRTSHLLGHHPKYDEIVDQDMPANLNDADINPSMTELPSDQNRMTEMTFCLSRYEVGHFFITQGRRLHDATTPVAERDELINTLESLLEMKYLRYCDPAIVIHQMIIHGARSVINRLRLMAHHPSRYPDKGKSMSHFEHDMIFRTCMEIISNHMRAYSMKEMDAYSWHVDTTFQIDAVVFMLIEAQNQDPTAATTEKAWDLVDTVFNHRPDLLQDTELELYAAVRQLTLNAWKARELEAKKRGIGPLTAPPIIDTLKQMALGEQSEQSEEEPTESPVTESNQNSVIPIADPIEFPTFNDQDLAYPGWEAMDWNSWDYWNDLLQSQN